MDICYEVGCIGNKLRFWIREAQVSGKMAGSQGGLDVLLVPACSCLVSQTFFLFESIYMCTLVYSCLLSRPALKFMYDFLTPEEPGIFLHVADFRVVYRARPSLPARVVPCSIILNACGAEGREGLADVIRIHNRLTNQILLSRTGKQLVHNF